MTTTHPCYCGNLKSYSDCCERFHLENDTAKTAEELMRSRYSAFATQNFTYLLKTQDPQTSQLFDLDSNKKWAASVTFIKLEILNSRQMHNTGFVEFNAHYKIKTTGEMHIHHEKSQFKLDQGQWFYIMPS